jgi:hypothetical protein
MMSVTTAMTAVGREHGCRPFSHLAAAIEQVAAGLAHITGAAALHDVCYDPWPLHDDDGAATPSAAVQSTDQLVDS